MGDPPVSSPSSGGGGSRRSGGGSARRRSRAATRVGTGRGTVDTYPLRVWLVEYYNRAAGHHDIFYRRDADVILPRERRQCRQRIQTLLQDWLTRVVGRAAQSGFATHATAQRSTSYEDRVVVEWTDNLRLTQLNRSDLVIYFCPWNTGGQTPDTATRPDNPPVTGVLHGAYRDAVRSLNIEALTRMIDQQCREPNGTNPNAREGGSTTVEGRSVPSSGTARWPALCQVYVFYRHQDDNGGYYPAATRASINADWMAMHAFHEAMHVKDVVTANIDMHAAPNVSYAGPSPAPSASGPNDADVDLMAAWVWAWCPMYVVGETLRLYQTGYNDYVSDPGSLYSNP